MMNLGSLLNQGCFKNTVFFVEKHCVSVGFLNPGFKYVLIQNTLNFDAPKVIF